MRFRRTVLAALIAVTAFAATLGTADAADDGSFYRLTSGTVVCAPADIALGDPSSVDVNYPAGATLSVEVDFGGGFGGPGDFSFVLNPAGASGVVGFFGFGINLPSPSSVTLRVTLSVGGTPTYQQTFTFTCPNAVPPDTTEAGTLEIVSETTFPFADPPAATDPATAIVAQPTTTG